MGERARKDEDITHGPPEQSNGINEGDADGQQTLLEMARYVADMVNELKIMCEGADMLFLAYLLDLAHEEAEAQVRQRLDG